MVHHHTNDHEGHNAETTPLLSPSPTERRESPAAARRTRCSWPWIYVVLLCIALAVVSDIGEDLYAAPRVRLFESVACTRHYLQNDPSLVNPDGSVPEHLCKIDAVQGKVASIIGWQLFFESIPAILLPIPYGYLADSQGRKWILVLALTGYALSWASTLFLIGIMHVSLNYVWLSSLFFVVGGGPTVGTTLITTVIADVVPTDARSTVFFYRFCTDLIADLIISPITSILMHRSTWDPLLLAVAFQGLSIIIALSLPETLPMPDFDDAYDTFTVTANNQDTDEQSTFDGKSMKWIQQIRRSFSFVARDRAVLALVFTFLISKVGRQANNVLFQYASKKYGWTLSQANLLLSLRAGVNLALFTIILPSITTYALSRTGSGARDLWVGKGSIILLLLGNFIVFSSSAAVAMVIGLIISTLGMGFAPIMRSLATVLVESQHESETSDIGRLYALISVMEGIGSLMAGPGMAWTFQLGMGWGYAWLGLPFGFAAVLFTLISILIFKIKI